jgi:hypothetical protein
MCFALLCVCVKYEAKEHNRLYITNKHWNTDIIKLTINSRQFTLGVENNELVLKGYLGS